MSPPTDCCSVMCYWRLSGEWAISEWWSPYSPPPPAPILKLHRCYCGSLTPGPHFSVGPPIAGRLATCLRTCTSAQPLQASQAGNSAGEKDATASEDASRVNDKQQELVESLADQVHEQNVKVTKMMVTMDHLEAVHEHHGEMLKMILTKALKMNPPPPPSKYDAARHKEELAARSRPIALGGGSVVHRRSHLWFGQGAAGNPKQPQQTPVTGQFVDLGDMCKSARCPCHHPTESGTTRQPQWEAGSDMLPPRHRTPAAVSVPAEKERARNWEERKQQSNWAQSRPTHGQ